MGVDFLTACDKEHTKISCAIDRNPKREGKILPSGHVVRTYEAVKDSIDTVLVMNKAFFGDVTVCIRESRPETQVICLDYYLMDKALEAVLLH